MPAGDPICGVCGRYLVMHHNMQSCMPNRYTDPFDPFSTSNLLNINNETVADKLFKVKNIYTQTEENVQSQIAEVLGCADNWCFDDITFDSYDSSFEVKDTTERITLTDEQKEKFKSMGFQQCWICYMDEAGVKEDHFVFA